MAEGLTENVGMYKIWKNPSDSVQPVEYQGEFRPPDGQSFFTARDLHALGLGPGDYTVLAPEHASRHKLFGKWQKVTVPA